MSSKKPMKSKVRIPKRQPSLVIPERKPVFITADKITCVECPCFPKESPYRKPPKLNRCLRSPLTLYELASTVVNRLPFPIAFEWSEDDVVVWMSEVVGLPQYKNCILDNYINGRRLLLLEDRSNFAELNIHNYDHIVMIQRAIHQLYSTEFIKFSRSISLPPRKPLTHCTFFKSRTSPSWGIHRNWSRCDVLRWMKILDPEPIEINHWDYVWYEKPDFPKTMFARIPPAEPSEKLPMYKPPDGVCMEYQALRRFPIEETNIPAKIWLEHRICSMTKVDILTSIKEMIKPKKSKPVSSRLLPKKINLDGLKGDALILARRVKPKEKFLSIKKCTK